MVGVAIGLFVVAGATLVVSTQLGDNRRLLLETQLQQDLRATLDIVTRELRRSGGVADATALGGVWHPGLPLVLANNLARITLNADLNSIEFSYRRAGGEGPYGFRLNDGAIQSYLGPTWQDLTDRNVMRVTAFTVTPDADLAPVQVPCPKDCNPDPAVDDTTCWPELAVRAYTVDITARSVSDVNVQRSIRSTVRLRNDVLNFNDPLNPTQVCPS
jgi:type IV pilus assembly protein PilW